MEVFRRLCAVPAYVATKGTLRSAPFIVSLLLYDSEGEPRLPPAVVNAINRTVVITGREGMVTWIVADNVQLPLRHRALQDAMMRDDAIILFRCQSAETAERLMQYFHEQYTLALVQEKLTMPEADADTRES